MGQLEVNFEIWEVLEYVSGPVRKIRILSVHHNRCHSTNT